VPSGSQIAARASILQLMTALLPDIRREQITLAPLARLVGSTELPPCPGAMCLHSAADVVPLGGADCAPEKAFANRKGFANKKHRVPCVE
jgi:hypothetical protein